MDSDPTRLISEGLARAMDRRTFLKRLSQTIFVGAVALASGHTGAARAGGALFSASVQWDGLPVPVVV